MKDSALCVKVQERKAVKNRKCVCSHTWVCVVNGFKPLFMSFLITVINSLQQVFIFITVQLVDSKDNK